MPSDLLACPRIFSRMKSLVIFVSLGVELSSISHVEYTNSFVIWAMKLQNRIKAQKRTQDGEVLKKIKEK